ncbi:MAG TPA: BolA/IbaG family iron-sulfur metabolism protein [Marinagarivorans sp.]
MQAENVKALISQAITDSDVEVTVDGSHVHLVVVSEVFAGLNAVKRQQLVYGALQEVIASGEIHAVHMKTYTPAERPSQA